MELEELSEAITNQLEEILKLLAELNEPFEAAIDHQLEKLGEIYSKIKDVWVLLSVDTANQLGITITFKEFEGD
jgi:predicted lipoprotein